MSQGDESAANYARKGKGRLIEGTSEPSPPSPQPTSRQRTTIHRLLNEAAPMRPFSSGPSAHRPEPAPINFPSSFPPTTSQLIDQVMEQTNQNLKNALYARVEKQAMEQAAHKVFDKELELHSILKEAENEQEKINEYTRQIDKLLGRVISWRKTVAILQDKWTDVIGNKWKENMAESSHRDNERAVGPVRLDCMVCKKFVSAIMVWPCRHVCVCTTCNEFTEFCPECHVKKLSTVEVCISTSD